MKFTDFKKIIGLIKKQHVIELRVAKSLDSILDGHFVPQMSVSLSEALMIALDNIYGKDQMDTLSWWLWECDFGKGARMWKMDNTPIPVKTVRQLWEYMESCRKSKK